MLDLQRATAQKPSEGVRQIVKAAVKPPVDADIASDGSEEAKIHDDVPLDEKRKRSPSIGESLPSKRIKPNSEETKYSFERTRNLPRRLPCEISYDEHAPMNPLYTVDAGFASLSLLDAGRYGGNTAVFQKQRISVR